MWIVRVALDRPYTFIVLAVLILVLSPVMILRTPTDIFPNIDIPVIAVAWQYTGMNPEELEGRLTNTYERLLTIAVDNIEHIESTTVNGQAIVKIYLQHGASLDTANAQVTAGSQTILRLLPPGTLPPVNHQLQRFERPHSAVGPFRKWTLGAAAERPRTEFPEAATGDRAWGRHSFPVWRQATSGHDRFESRLGAIERAGSPRRSHCGPAAKSDFAVRDSEDGPVRIRRSAERQHEDRPRAKRPPGQGRWEFHDLSS